MVKLKNLWKIVLVIMAVSAMLIACTTDSNDTGEKEDDPMAEYKTTPVTARAESFPGGLKFTTEEGWDCQYISDKASPAPVNKVYARLNGEPAAMKNIAINKFVGDQQNDESTKIFVDKNELEPEKLYTLTYDVKNGILKLTEAADGVEPTSIEPQKADETGTYPSGIYINGYLGKYWGGATSPVNTDTQYSILMDVVNEENEVYAFTWKAPAATVTVTLKITVEDTTNDTTVESILYLKDCPVKTDGTTEIDGSIYGWNSAMGGTAVTIRNEDGSKITGGILEAAATATGNAAWALSEYINGNEGVDLAEKFKMIGADDVLKLLIDLELWVPYIKGKVATFSWKNAQGSLEKPGENAGELQQ